MSTVQELELVREKLSLALKHRDELLSAVNEMRKERDRATALFDRCEVTITRLLKMVENLTATVEVLSRG